MVSYFTITFRNYKAIDLTTFNDIVLHHEYANIQNVVKISTKHFDAEDKRDLTGERDEAKYSFEFKDYGDTWFHHGRCVALAEMNSIFDNTQRKLKKTTTLDSTGCIFVNFLSKDLYPTEFSFENILPVGKVVFGNIFKKFSYNPTLGVWSRGQQDLLQEFLTQQKGLQGFPHPMVSVFEHDQECFSVFFTDVYQKCTRVVELRVPYSSIRRIVACFRHRDGQISADLTFQLASPPFVHPRRQQNGTAGIYFSRERFSTWNKAFVKEEDLSLSSCVTLECHTLDAYQILNCLSRLRKMTGHDIQYMNLPMNLFVKHQFYIKNFFYEPDVLPEGLHKLHDYKYFPLTYAIEALVAKGGEIYDHFFRKPYGSFVMFVQCVLEFYEQDLDDEPNKPFTRTVRALELMLEKMDKLLDIPDPAKFFASFYEQLEYNNVCESQMKLEKEGFMRVRKVIATPSRIILCNPETVIGNRCLRRIGSDRMIRVVFRDNNNAKLFGAQKGFVSRCLDNFLKYPQTIGMQQFSYLGSSDSQIHDHGCYLMAGTQEDAIAFRNTFGKFPIKSIPKMMSAFGQCLTQSRKSRVGIGREMFSEFQDIKAGLDGNGNQYNFTDGVGVMDKRFAKMIAQDLGYPKSLPACIQFRFRGYKGSLALDTTSDAMRQNLQRQNNIVESNPGILFRPSQRIFDGPREESIEIIKVSTPNSVTLNKPLINILDQVSRKQDGVVHSAVKDRILTLLESDIKDVVSTLINSEHAVQALSIYSKLIPFQLFKDCNVIDEPFFRSMLRSAAVVRLYRLIEKMKINIPPSHGRMMFGVVDENRILKPGQVFVRITNNVFDKFPSESAEKTTITGRVMITKKSATSKGDIRMYEAVDVKEFSDLVDVVVFPNNGKRPHPLEICGSHLDGEFIVIWDSDLLLHYNEKAFDYTPPITEKPANRNDPDFFNKLPEMMVDSFKTYITEDSIGTVSNAHLANSDLFGIFSTHVASIARKRNQAENFQKTGIIPEALTRTWSEDGKIPPEKVEKFPNFMAKTDASTYKSEGICGVIHERLIEVKAFMEAEIFDTVENPVFIDQSFIVAGDEDYYNDAVQLCNEYSLLIQDICLRYGIASEGQLFSNHFNTMKKRLSERDENNMTQFNAQFIVEEQLTNIFENIRQQFFKDFGGLEKNTQNQNKSLRPGFQPTFARICDSPSTEVQKKASAFYRAAYGNKKCLSFAWCVADVLMINRRNNSLTAILDKKVLSPSFLEDKISAMINEATTKFADEFTTFCNNIVDVYANDSSNDVVSYIAAQYCHYFPGLRKLLFYIRKWYAQQKIGIDILPKKLDALFIFVGLGYLGNATYPWLTIIKNRPAPIADLENHKYCGLGKIFMKFMKCVANKNLCAAETFRLQPITNQVLSKNECLALNYQAMETLFPLAFNRSFDAFPGMEQSRDRESDEYESDNFVIDLPLAIQDENWEELLKNFSKRCGCKHICIKRKAEPRVGHKTFRIALRVVGTLWNVSQFRRDLIPTPNMKIKDLQKRSDMLAAKVYYKLKGEDAD